MLCKFVCYLEEYLCFKGSFCESINTSLAPLSIIQSLEILLKGVLHPREENYPQYLASAERACKYDLINVWATYGLHAHTLGT